MKRMIAGETGGLFELTKSEGVMCKLGPVYERVEVIDLWCDFNTAPSDGIGILVWRKDAGVFIASCQLTEDGENDCWFSSDGDDLTGDLPTAWMPLPVGPEKTARKSGLNPGQ